MAKELTLEITGMSCQHCSQTVEKALNNRVGVESAEVDLNKEEAYVKYDPEQLTLEDLIKEVEDSGYGVNRD